MKVVIRIGQPALSEFEHFGWKQENVITKRSDHWLVEMHVDRFEWLAPLVLSYGGDVTIIEPPELRDRVTHGALKLIERHSGAATAEPATVSPREPSDIRNRAVCGRGAD